MCRLAARLRWRRFSSRADVCRLYALACTKMSMATSGVVLASPLCRHIRGIRTRAVSSLAPFAWCPVPREPKGCHSRRRVAPVPPRSGPTIACPRHDVSAMPGRLRAALSELKPAARQHKVQSAVGKRRLFNLSPSAGRHLVTQAKQIAVVKLFGLRRAAASAFIRTAQAA